ncbi:MAG: hypothetical protein ACU0AU_06840 [Cognatishimia activa]
MKRLTFAAILCFFPHILHSGEGIRELVPSLHIQADVDQAAVSTLLEIITAVQSKGSSASNSAAKESRPNLYFASGADFIVDGMIALDALEGIGGDVQSFVGLPANSDVCYVQSFVFADADWVLVAIHNRDEDQPYEWLHMCFVTALWKFAFGNVDNINLKNWTDNFLKVAAAFSSESI